MMLDPESALKEARDQLMLILSFFPRIDAKASTILAVNTGMLGFLALKCPNVIDITMISAAMASTATVFLAASFWFLYRVTFPELEGGQQSLIYFQEIAARTESVFIDQFNFQNQTARTRDLLGQVWRNSGILKEKFRALRLAVICTAVAVVPWMIAIALFSAYDQIHHQLN